VRISTQRNSKGCENPKALSSVTMAGEIAAMKINKQNLSTLVGKQKRYEKITKFSRSLVRQTLTKTEALCILNVNLRHTFNGGAKILKNETQIAPLSEVSMER